MALINNITIIKEEDASPTLKRGANNKFLITAYSDTYISLSNYITVTAVKKSILDNIDVARNEDVNFTIKYNSYSSTTETDAGETYKYKCTLGFKLTVPTSYVNDYYYNYVAITFNNQDDNGETYSETVCSDMYLVYDAMMLPLISLTNGNVYDFYCGSNSDVYKLYINGEQVYNSFKNATTVTDDSYILESNKGYFSYVDGYNEKLYTLTKLDNIDLTITTTDNDDNSASITFPKLIEPKINLLSQNVTELPSGGGKVKLSVLYEDCTNILSPVLYMDTKGYVDYTEYLSDESVVAGDLYNYVFNFPSTTTGQMIEITLKAEGEFYQTVTKYCLVSQNYPTGDPDIDNPTVDKEIILGSSDNEFGYISSNHLLDIKVTLPIDETIGRIEVVNPSDWISVNLIDSVTVEKQYYKELTENWMIQLDENINEENRNSFIEINYYDSNNKKIDSKEYTIVQDGTLSTNDKVYCSVWENTILEINEDVFNYNVVMSTMTNGISNNITVFQGRAYKYPDADTIQIKVNKIFENYLSNSIDEIHTSLKNNYEACKRFFIINNDTNRVIKEYIVLYDWSYKYKWRGNSATLSKPINNRYASNMYKFNTTVNSVGIVTNHINIVNNNTNVMNVCNDYALYYLNSYGGWNSYLIEGEVDKVKNINYYTTEKYVTNLNLDFEQTRYISELQNSYTLKTGFLTNEEATNMVNNLFTSNEVYLHNLKTNEIISVIITDTKVNYKKYTINQELPQYTINIKESQVQLKR